MRRRLLGADAAGAGDSDNESDGGDRNESLHDCPLPGPGALMCWVDARAKTLNSSRFSLPTEADRCRPSLSPMSRSVG